MVSSEYHLSKEVFAGKETLIWGLVAGTIYHVLVQYPRQKSLFVTFYAIGVANLIFAGIFLISEAGTAPSRSLTEGVHVFLKDLFIFNLSFVKSMQKSKWI